MDRTAPKTAEGRLRPAPPRGPAEDPAAEAPRRARPEPGQLPSLAQQKRFIVDNVAVLNRETKISILSIVMMEVGATVPEEAVGAPPEGGPGDPKGATPPRGVRSVMFESGGREIDIDLDAVGSINPEVLTHIYNIVHARREQLSQPARQ